MKENDSLTDSGLIRYLDLFATISTECFYMVDVRKQQICFVRPDDFFLCGYTVEDALNQADDFYRKIIYSGDFSLWTIIRNAVLRYLDDSEEPWDEIDYFSCTLRLHRTYNFSPPNSFPQMVYHRMKPVWDKEELRYLICSLRCSMAKESGNLRMYGKDELTYKEYRIVSRKWRQITIKPLTKRERAILMLAQQGKSAMEIASDLCKGYNTVRNQIKEVFFKLQVHSMMEAIETASNHRMIYVLKQVITKMEHPPVEAPRKRTRVLITDEIIQHIQQHLDNGMSVRKAADREGISESAIRYWKGKKKFR